MSQVAVVTVANQDTSQLQRTIRSCRRFGFTPEVLGYSRAYPCNFFKLKFFIEYIEKHPSVRTMFYMDGFDVLAAAPIHEIFERYEDMEQSVVMSAEKNCWPDKKFADKFPDLTPYRYPCSGLWIGSTDHLLPFFRQACQVTTEWYYSDQACVTELMAGGEWPQVYLDTKCELFQSMYASENDLEFKDGKLHNRLTGTTPLMFHGNGRSKLPPQLLEMV